MDFAEVMDSPEMAELVMEQVNNPKMREVASSVFTGTGGIVGSLKTGKKMAQTSPTFDNKHLEAVTKLMKMEPNPREAKRLKEEGNELFKKKKYEEAAEKYTAAMRFALDPALYCNRSAAHHGMKDYYKSLRDCRATLALDPGYAKAYVRMGLTFTSLENHGEAVEAYKKAVEMQPRDQRHKDSLKAAEKMLQKQRANPTPGIKSSVRHDVPSAEETKP